MRISLAKFISALFIILILLFFIIISAYQIKKDFNDSQFLAQKMRTDFVHQQKAIIHREVERVAQNILYEKNLAETNLKKNIKEKVNQAFGMVRYIWAKNRGRKPKAEIIQQIKEALRPIRFFNGQGYYYIIDLQGREILSAGFPKLEGKNMLLSTDKQIQKDTRQLIDYFKSGKDEGYFISYWPRPGHKDIKKYKGVTFVKLFKPLNWCIGTSDYLDAEEKAIQEEQLNKIVNVRFGKEGYIFVNKYDGKALISNGKRIESDKTLWQAFGPRAKSVFNKELAAAHKPKGDFIYYSWKKLTSDTLSPKASFIKGIPEWQWIVGAGVYLDDVEKDINVLQKSANANLQKKIYTNLAILLTILFLFLLIRYFLVKYVGKELSLFLSFFKRAAFSNEKINLSKIKFNEFYDMAKHANKMLDDKRAIEKKLQEEKENLAVTLRSIADSVITTDTSGRITSMNRVAEKLTGHSSEEAKEQPLMNIFHVVNRDTREPLENPVQKILQKKTAVFLDRQTLLISKHGREYIIEDSAAPIRDAESNVIGTVLVFRDVTEKIKNEQEIQKIKKLESIGILAGGIAHDFNNLLTGIFGNLSLIKMHIHKGDKIFKYLESAEKSIDRATNLTSQLLTFAKGGQPVKQDAQIGPLIREAALFNLRGSNIKLDIKISRALWPVKVDKGQFSQVIANLVINAKQAMPRGGALSIRLTNFHNSTGRLPLSAKQCIRIRIKDEGTGIKNKYLERIFDPYFSTKNQGSGLGLATVYSIIKRHEGFVEVKSQWGKGSTFTIYLPASASADPHPASVKNKRASSEQTIAALRFLVMDDEQIIRQVTAEMLHSLGHTVEFAGSGEEALKKYERQKNTGRLFDIVILDLTVPGAMGGRETIEKILKINPQAKVIVASGYSNDPILADYEKYGFKGKIIKPFRMEEFKQAIEQVINS